MLGSTMLHIVGQNVASVCMGLKAEEILFTCHKFAVHHEYV